MATNMERAEAIHNQLARGTIALALLEEISDHVASFDERKRNADAAYSAEINSATLSLATRIAVSVARANAALDSLEPGDDDDDDDDDD